MKAVIHIGGQSVAPARQQEYVIRDAWIGQIVQTAARRARDADRRQDL